MPSDSLEDEQVNIEHRDLFLELARLTDQLGKIPSSEEIDDHTKYTAEKYKTNFGSIMKACEKAGLISSTEISNHKLCSNSGTDEISPRVNAIHNTENQNLLSEYVDLNSFKRDILVVISGLDSPHGLELKAELEKYYSEAINHGRLYPSLDSLEELGLIHKFKKDKRSNDYRITKKGEVLIKNRYSWQENIVQFLENNDTALSRPENGPDESNNDSDTIEEEFAKSPKAQENVNILDDIKQELDFSTD